MDIVYGRAIDPRFFKENIGLIRLPYSFYAVLVMALVPLGVAWSDECHPELNPQKSQYIIGYGSLMEHESKQATQPDAGINLPILVKGFQRAWNTHGVYPTTYLGVTRSDSATMAAALYRDFPGAEGKLASDAREIDYCRGSVNPASIKMLDGSEVPTSSEVWIYVTKKESLAPPDDEHPIVQSYVDIFITGCLQLQARVQDPTFDFVEQCILTTDDWSPHWVNDRIYPRRPFGDQPNAFKIDHYLNQLLPEIVAEIRIE